MSDIFNPNEAIETLIERYKATVYGVALSYVNSREDADDIFQEVFLTLYKVKPEFNSEEHRKAWLIRTAKNFALRVVDSTYNRRVTPSEEIESGSVTFKSKEENAIYLAIKSLPESYRDVIYLFYFEDMSVDQIAKTLNLTSSNVKVRLMRAREQLKEILRREEEFSNL